MSVLLGGSVGNQTLAFCLAVDSCPLAKENLVLVGKYSTVMPQSTHAELRAFKARLDPIDLVQPKSRITYVGFLWSSIAFHVSGLVHKLVDVPVTSQAVFHEYVGSVA